MTVLGDPGPGLTGRHLVVTLALAVFAGSAAMALSRPRKPSSPSQGLLGRIEVLLAAGFVGALVLSLMQPQGPGWLGVFLTAGAAAARVPLRRAAMLLALCLAGFVAAYLLGHQGDLANLITTELGVAAFFLIALLSRRLREGQAHAEELLAELAATRDSQIQAAALRERERLARDIHDVLAHTLSGLVVTLEGARLQLSRPGSDPDAVTSVDRALHLARNGLDEARRAVGTLRGDGLPRVEQLGVLTDGFARQTGVPCSLQVLGSPRPLDPEQQVALYRTAQEALTNVRKHARPDEVTVTLAYRDAEVGLTIEDRARVTQAPPALAASGSGYGLTGMRERAELLGGRLVAGPSAHGFRVEVWLPLDRDTGPAPGDHAADTVPTGSP